MSNINQSDLTASISPEHIPREHITRYPDNTCLVFLSDVHLGSFGQQQDQQIQKNVIRLLNHCKTNNYRLVILGDLFDYWMEYPGWHPKLGSELLDAFQDYHKEQPSTLYITGNHDHWYLDYLDEIGFTMEDEYRLLRIGQKKIFAMHGDGLSDHRWELPRSLFNRLLRSSWFIKLFRSVFAPETGLSVMKLLSQFNKQFESEQKTRQNRRLNRWGHSLMSVRSFDAVVCGHNHNPQIETFNSGIFLNPGPFGIKHTVGWYKQNSFKLMKWEQDKCKLTDLNQNQAS